jgi:tetratricopeptide (TPR) repeat protein
MTKNPWLFLLAGLIIGLVIGYIIADHQLVQPPVSLAPPSSASPMNAPAPVMKEQRPSTGASEVERQISEIRGLLAENPGDPVLQVALGNIYFDAQRWEEARLSYEEAVETTPDDANVLTDLAVVYRNLGKPERALEILAQVIDIAPKHWQAVYNRVIVLHFDLHRHEEAIEALDELEALARENPQIPDVSGLAEQVRHQ